MTERADATNPVKFLTEDRGSEISETNKFTEQALRDHKLEGLTLAVRARWIALAVIAIMLPLQNPKLEVLYYEALLCLFALGRRHIFNCKP